MRPAAALLCLLAAGCGPSGPAGRFASRHGDLLRSPDQVRAFRIQPPEGPGRGDPGDFASYKVLSGPVAVDAGTTAEIARLLTDEKSWYVGSPKACIPLPGVRIDYVRGGRSAALFICFECRQLFMDGASGDFDPAYPDWTAVARRLFPDDPAIRSLK